MIAPVVRVEPGRDSTLAGVVRVDAQRARAQEALERAWTRAGAPRSGPRTDGDGAPIAVDGWHWSRSHTRDCAAAVVSSAPVGIDVEPIAWRKAARYSNVVSEDERRLLGDLDALLFTRLWTAKESVLKRAGVGLAELSDCRVVDAPSGAVMRVAHRDTLHVVQQSIEHGFVVSLCAGLSEGTRIDWIWSA